MRATRQIVVGLVTVAALISAALVEAIRIDQEGLAVMIVLALAVMAGVGVRVARQPLIAVRPDLARWATQVAAATGEPPERLVDRSLSAYRSGLGPGSANDGD